MFHKTLAIFTFVIVPEIVLAAPAQRCRIDFIHSSSYQCMQSDTTACSAADAEVNYVTFSEASCGIVMVNTLATDDASWVSNGNTNGWEPPGDNTDDEGNQFLIGANNSATAQGPCVFSPGAAYYVKVTMTVQGDPAEYDVLAVGFRNDAAFSVVDDPADINTTTPAYTDFALINVNAGDFRTYTQDDDATATDTNVTTANWAADESHTLMVKVSAAGAVTYFVDGTAMAGAVAFTLDQAAADIYVPTVIAAQSATAAVDNPPEFELFECGLQ